MDDRTSLVAQTLSIEISGLTDLVDYLIVIINLIISCFHLINLSTLCPAEYSLSFLINGKYTLRLHLKRQIVIEKG